MWKSLATALSFLTILRVPFTSTEAVSSEDLAQSFSCFPLVGLILGACYASLARLLSPLVPPLLLSVTITAVMLGLTRALHMDGLADLADGLGGGYTPERRLEIMKDSRTGPFGAIAVVLAVAFKIAALDVLISRQLFSLIVLAPVFSRFAMVLTAYGSPYARKTGGLARPFLENITRRQIVTASFFTAVLAVFINFSAGLSALVFACASVALLRFYCRRLLGGVTGDVLGAANEIVEVVALFVFACLP